MMRFPPQVIYRLLLPGVLVFVMSCSLLFDSEDSTEEELEANSKFDGCRKYDDPATIESGDFWIVLNSEMPDAEDTESLFVLAGCVATRRVDPSNLVAYVTLSGSVNENDPNEAILLARDREGGAGSMLHEIEATLRPGPDGEIDDNDPLIRFRSSSHPAFNIDESLNLAAEQCTCDDLEDDFEGPQQVAPPTSAGGINAAAAAIQDFPEQLVLGDNPRIAAPRRDPRFFGSYCQIDPVEVCKTVRVSVFGVGLFNKKVCRDITDTTVSIDHIDGRLNGSLYGLGGFKLGDQSSSLAVSGTVVGRGIANVSLQLPGLDNRSEGMNNARLASMVIPGRGVDHRLTIDAYDTTLVLGKQACGNRVPQVTIASASGNNLNWGHNHCFTGTVTQDDDSAFPRSRLTIASSTDGEFAPPNATIASSGPLEITRCTTGLSPGPHDIEFVALDSGGLSAKASLEVTVTNRPPQIPILIQPRSDDTVVARGDVIFEGKSFDFEQGMLSGPALTWTASLDGGPSIWLGYGSQLVANFPKPGLWKLQLIATDGVGESSEVSSVITVLPNEGNTPPRVTIDVPPHLYVPGWYGGSFPSGDVVFRGTIDDSEEAPSGLRLRWDARPILPDGAALAPVLNSTLAIFPLTSNTRRAVYEITFRATDSGGLEGKKVIQVVISPE